MPAGAHRAHAVARRRRTRPAERRVPSRELAREVWGDGADQENSALWTLVSRLRKKLRSEESRLEIASLRGGYLLEQL